MGGARCGERSGGGPGIGSGIIELRCIQGHGAQTTNDENLARIQQSGSVLPAGSSHAGSGSP